MDPGCSRMRMNLEKDRLSSLSDDLIHKILSSVSIKHVVETSVLSSRWRFIWTTMPYLNFLSDDFDTLPKFSNFVTHVLSRLNNQIQVSSVKLRFCGMVSEGFVKQIMDYAFSHNVQQLIVNFLLGKDIKFPLSLFNSQSLKHLTLTGPTYYQFINLASTWELPALTTLHLENVTLFDHTIDTDIHIFSKCPNLKNLTLRHCQVWGSDGLSICHPNLTNVTLVNVDCIWDVFFLDAPQLKNLTIISFIGADYRISAPALASFIYKGYCSLFFFKDGFLFLEKAHICIYAPQDASAASILGQLRQLHNVKYLTLNLEIIQLLSSFVELISNQPSPFANLKYLKVYPKFIYWFKNRNKKLVMSTEVIDYLLGSSRTTTFKVISHKDSIADMDATSSHNSMSRLHELLEQKKANIITSKAPTESHTTKSFQDSCTSATFKIASLEVLLDGHYHDSNGEPVTEM